MILEVLLVLPNFIRSEFRTLNLGPQKNLSIVCVKFEKAEILGFLALILVLNLTLPHSTLF